MSNKKQDNWTPPIPEVSEHWCLIDFDDAFHQLSTNGFKIAQKEYLPSGDYPIIDQGQEIIGGYTNNPKMVLKNSEHSIVFGDHTRCFKLISFPFAPGADGIKVLKPIDKIDLKFAFYALQSITLPNRGYSRHFSFLRKSVLPFCHPNEQKKIVTKIEELFSELDKGVESLKKAQEQLKIYRQSILKHAFDGKLTAKWREENGVPYQWDKKSVSEIGEIETGNTPSKKIPEYFGGDIPFYKPKDLEKGSNIFEAEEYLTREGFNKARKIPANSILVTCIGATIGKTGLIKREGATNQQINAIIPNNSYLPEFVYFQVISLFFQEQINDNYSQTTLPILNKSKFSKLKLIVCPIEEQKQIVAEIEEKFSVISQMERDISYNLKRADVLRHAILKKAFSGKLVDQDPNDEPASVLLERIAQEKQQAKPAKRTKKKVSNA